MNNQKDTIKNIAIVVNAPPIYPDLADLISNIANDIIKLQKNYIIHKKGKINKSWTNECRNLQGVIYFIVEEAIVKKGSVYLSISGALYRCANKEVIWKATGGARRLSNNDDLKELIETYKGKFNEKTGLFTAPVFSIIQDIIKSLPDPVLTDDEIMKKIELDSSVYLRRNFFEIISQNL